MNITRIISGIIGLILISYLYISNILTINNLEKRIEELENKINEEKKNGVK